MSTITTNMHLIGIIADHCEQECVADLLTSIRYCYEEQRAVTEQINELTADNAYYYGVGESAQEMKLDLQKKWREAVLSAVPALSRLDNICIKHGMSSFMENLDAENSAYRVQGVLNLCAAIAR